MSTGFWLGNKPVGRKRDECRFSYNADHGALFINSKAGVAGTREWQCHAKASATERRAGSWNGSSDLFPPSSSSRSSPPPLSHFSLYVSYHPLSLPRSPFYSFTLGSPFFYAVLSVRSPSPVLLVVRCVPRSLCFSLSPLAPPRSRRVGPRRTIRPPVHPSDGCCSSSFRFSSFLLRITATLPRFARSIHCLSPVPRLSRIVALPLARQHAVVGEWMNALSAPAAEIKRADRFLLYPSPSGRRPAVPLRLSAGP